MKQKFLLIGLLGILTFSCEKDNQKPKDEIIIKDLSPDIEIQTVRHYDQSFDTTIKLEDIPTPKDSIAIFDLDINDDSIMDFRFTVAHGLDKSSFMWRYEIPEPEFWKDFAYQISIKGLSAENFVSVNLSQSSFEYNHLDTVFSVNLNPNHDPLKDNSWSNFALVYCDGKLYAPWDPEYEFSPHSAGTIIDFKGEYLGVKIKNSYGFINIQKMANNGIKILGCGFNKTANNSITCDQ
jgi:hypothetical protein